MTIFTICVDQERGCYVAFCRESPGIRAESYIGADEAVGKLVRHVKGTTASAIDEIIDLDAVWSKAKQTGLKGDGCI